MEKSRHPTQTRKPLSVFTAHACQLSGWPSRIILLPRKSLPLKLLLRKLLLLKLLLRKLLQRKLL